MSDEQVHGHWDKDQQRYEDGEKSHPCVHAPVGPDWAGTREPSSWKERALAAEDDARDTVVVSRLVSSWTVVEGESDAGPR